MKTFTETLMIIFTTFQLFFKKNAYGFLPGMGTNLNWFLLHRKGKSIAYLFTYKVTIRGKIMKNNDSPSQIINGALK